MLSFGLYDNNSIARMADCKNYICIFFSEKILNEDNKIKEGEMNTSLKYGNEVSQGITICWVNMRK